MFSPLIGGSLVWSGEGYREAVLPARGENKKGPAGLVAFNLRN